MPLRASDTSQNTGDSDGERLAPRQVRSFGVLKSHEPGEMASLLFSLSIKSAKETNSDQLKSQPHEFWFATGTMVVPF